MQNQPIQVVVAKEIVRYVETTMSQLLRQIEQRRDPSGRPGRLILTYMQFYKWRSRFGMVPENFPVFVVERGNLPEPCRNG